MSKSRYGRCKIVGNKYYETYSTPVRGLGYSDAGPFEGIRASSYVIQAGDRIDHLAARFFNDDTLWWVIAKFNGIAWPWSTGNFSPGREIKIPLDPNDVIDRIM